MDASIDIEIAYQKGLSFVNLSQSFCKLPYSIDFVNLKQTSLVYKTKRDIKRVSLALGYSLQMLLKTSYSSPSVLNTAFLSGQQPSMSTSVSSVNLPSSLTTSQQTQVASSQRPTPSSQPAAPSSANAARLRKAAADRQRALLALAASMNRLQVKTQTQQPSSTAITTSQHPTSTSLLTASSSNNSAASTRPTIVVRILPARTSTTVTSRTRSVGIIAPAASHPLQAPTLATSGPRSASVLVSKSSQYGTSLPTSAGALQVSSASASNTASSLRNFPKVSNSSSVGQQTGAQTQTKGASSCDDSDPTLQSYDFADDILSSYSDFSEVPSETPALNQPSNAKSKLTDFFSKTLRGAFSKYPRDWKPHPKSEDYLVFALPTTSDEYRKVETKFKESLPDFAIVSIKRVQNRWLWMRYSQAKTQLAKKNAGAVNEMELFHGAKETSSDYICASEEGFDMRFSRQGLWGQANYFAVKAFYSHHYAYTRKENSTKEIILANVLTGDSIECQPNTNLRFPPEKETKRGNLKQVRYDSVNGITQGYKVYMTYSNDRAYPAYVITYSEKSKS